MKVLVLAALALLATPALAQQAPRPAAPAAADTPGGIRGLRTGMAVISSDGVTVAKTAHIYNRPDYGAEDSFFTSDVGVFMERRIRGREAYVEGDTVRLRMTAAQFRARQQNPPGEDNGERRN
ncbi:hypothetical protein ACIQC9_12240 [Brevundimonas sp. NPDC092305]|uniref:hypothetical protein n=1 Tax=Brevundimonas sp. NPDC092305 TaxID=3363957 RepID=UPI0038065CF5